MREKKDVESYILFTTRRLTTRVCAHKGSQVLADAFADYPVAKIKSEFTK